VLTELDLLVRLADQMGVAVNTPSTAEHAEPVTPTWTTPEFECYETRPEITAYAGDGGPLWNNR